MLDARSAIAANGFRIISIHNILFEASDVEYQVYSYLSDIALLIDQASADFPGTIWRMKRQTKGVCSMPLLV